MTEFLETLKELHPDLSASYDKLAELYSRKLWHQLSVAIFDFMNDKNNIRGNNFVEMCNEFISKFEARLSPIKFSQIISIAGHSIVDPSEGVAFFTRILAARTRLGQEASLCLDMDVVLMKLKANLLTEAKDMLEEAEKILVGINSSESYAFSKFYKSSAEYRKVAGPPELFYRESILYLSYTPVSVISAEEQYVLATDMALAALISDDIYNFGEVLSTPVLHTLRGTPNSWLYELVVSLHKGDIDVFNGIVDNCRDNYLQQPSLGAKWDALKQKVVLLGLMNLVFERASHDRTLTFSDIAARTRIPTDQVEWVLMRAMSLGLIKGTINEMSKEANISWVQPRHMDLDQIRSIEKQFDLWSARVQNVLVSLEDQTPELFS